MKWGWFLKFSELREKTLVSVNTFSWCFTRCLLGNRQQSVVNEMCSYWSWSISSIKTVVWRKSSDERLLNKSICECMHNSIVWFLCLSRWHKSFSFPVLQHSYLHRACLYIAHRSQKIEESALDRGKACRMFQPSRKDSYRVFQSEQPNRKDWFKGNLKTRAEGIQESQLYFSPQPSL